MKGFIELSEINGSKKTLINVANIESVMQFQNAVTIYMINHNKYGWVVKDSYEEIVNKIKQATEE